MIDEGKTDMDDFEDRIAAVEAQQKLEKRTTFHPNYGRLFALLVLAAILPAYAHVIVIVARWSWHLLG